ncbi:MAG: radical SAM protein [Desulfarculus sp.]|jgi:radical SAM superfamily enzyme YgiQ (UPF0313 family)|nr:MAG: radical SAM protein [Desulfarculus sp.]
MILINACQDDTMKVFQPFARYNVPVGIGYLYAVLRMHGLPVHLIDEQVADDTLGLVENYRRQLAPPYTFGFSVLTAGLSRSLHLARRLKQSIPGCKVVFGGIHPSAAPEEILAFPQVDLVVRGEAEDVILDLYQALKRGEDTQHLPNLSYRRNGRLVHNPLQTKPVDLDALPPFPYELFTAPQYDLGAVMSSRGCPYNCIFCSNRVTTGKRYRYRAAEKIAQEIKTLHDQYGIRHILFLDDNLMVDRSRVYALLNQLRQMGLQGRISYTFQSRCDNVDQATLGDLYAAGFSNISFGLETASDHVMQTIKKGETVAQCHSAVALAKQIGFHVSATFIFGLPGETHAERLQSIAFAREHNLDLVRFNNATPYPGTELNVIAAKDGGLNVQGVYRNFNSVSTIIENPFNKMTFSYVPPGSSEEAIRNDILLAYLATYLNPRRLATLFKDQAPVKRWFNPGKTKLDLIRKLPALFVLTGTMAIKFTKLIWDVCWRRDTDITLREFLYVVFSTPSAAEGTGQGGK